MESQGSDKLAPKPSSPPSAPTTPSPVLAASFSRSTSASHTDSSPSFDNDGTAEPGPNSPSLQTDPLPPAVAHAIHCMRRQYPGVDTLGQTPASLAVRSFDKPSHEHSQTEYQGTRKQESHSVGSSNEHCGGDDSLWLEIRLTKQEWLILQEYIRSLENKDPELQYYIEEKLHYDYFVNLDILALRLRNTRMPSRIHEWLIRKIDHQVHLEFARVALREKERDKNSTLARFAEEVQPWGSLGLKFCQIPSRTPSEDGSDVEQEAEAGPPEQKAGVEGQHEPDCSYSITNDDKSYPNLYPAAIIEVVTSKKRDRLPMLADDYLLGTYVGPMVQVMLAIDIDIERLESGSTPRGLAKVMEYRRKEIPSAEHDHSPDFIVEEIEHIFCDQDGTRLPGEVRLSLSDFAPFGDDPRLTGHEAHQGISLSFEWLNDVLSDAEEQTARAAEMLKAAKQGTKRRVDEDELEQGQAKKRHTWPARGKRRKHERPPEDRLSVLDEDRIQIAEEEAERRAEYRDNAGARDYVPRTQPGSSIADASASMGGSRRRRSARVGNRVTGRSPTSWIW